jgi:hypothetical protein
MHEFVDEMTVLSRWLGRDVAHHVESAVPVWTAFRFRDAVVFEADVAGSANRMYLVRGHNVREFLVSQVPIDEVYADLNPDELLRAAA